MAEKFEQWGILELMGHQRTAGRLTEEMIAGSNLLRVDIPVNAHEFRTAYYGASAIYALHVTSEETARKAAGAMSTKPPYAYLLESERLPRITDGEDEDDPEPVF
jgi:hypothetical protein